jgi:metal-responsive CopG/Arc/MetJ family transcriptional regulator
MGITRINLGLAQAMLKDLDKLAEKYGWDRTNTIRYCIRYACDAELQNKQGAGRNETKEV